MLIVVHGQQAFGKAVLEALQKRGDNVVAVYAAPEKEGQKIDPLKEAALAADLPVYQPKSLKDDAARRDGRVKVVADIGEHRIVVVRDAGFKDVSKQGIVAGRSRQDDRFGVSR